MGQFFNYLKKSAGLNGAIINAWLVLSGDWGGQIYLTVPIHLIGQNENIVELLAWLDELSWDCNEGEGSEAIIITGEIDPELECLPVVGGMGGGMALEHQIWIHDTLQSELDWKLMRHQDNDKFKNLTQDDVADKVIELLDITIN